MHKNNQEIHIESARHFILLKNMVTVLIFSVVLAVLPVIYSLDTISIEPTKLTYQSTNGDRISTYEWKKWGGHHGFDSAQDANELLNLTAFANRWLKPDAAYFPSVPEDPKRPGYADLSWFNDPKNQEIVLGAFPQYLQEYGRDLQLIYCIGGNNWPPYMLNASNTSIKIPFNWDAGSELITESLQVIFNNQSILPKYFEPLNEPYGSKFGPVSLQYKMNFMDYINKKVYNQFGSVNNGNIIVGGPASAWDGIGWLKHTLWEDGFETFINNSSYPLGFISWHQFSLIKQEKNTNIYKYFFIGSGGVSSTMDLIESYTY